MTPEERARAAVVPWSQEARPAIEVSAVTVPLLSRVEDQIRAAIAEEREACAKVLDGELRPIELGDDRLEVAVKKGRNVLLMHLAAAIRART